MSITTLTAANSRRLVSLDRLLLEMGDSGNQSDIPLLEAMLDEVSAAIETACQRIFAQQRYVEILPMTRHGQLALTHYPLVSITSVLWPVTPLTPVTDYQVDSYAAAVLVNPTGWWTWTETPTMTVTYTAGYRLPEQTAWVEPTGPTLPLDLQRAALEAVKVWHYERLPSDRVASKTLGLTGDRVDYGLQSTKTAIPVLSDALLSRYRRYVLR